MHERAFFSQTHARSHSENRAEAFHKQDLEV
jgi:hypothetical protein